MKSKRFVKKSLKTTVQTLLNIIDTNDAGDVPAITWYQGTCFPRIKRTPLFVRTLEELRKALTKEKHATKDSDHD